MASPSTAPDSEGDSTNVPSFANGPNPSTAPNSDDSSTNVPKAITPITTTPKPAPPKAANPITTSPIHASLTHVGANHEVVTRAHADIQAIAADGNKTDAQKRELIKTRRAQACADHFKSIFDVTKTFKLTNADGQWTISFTGVDSNPSIGLVELFGVVILRNGNNVGLDSHQQFINPPLLFPDLSGPITIEGRGKFRIDPAAVILDSLIGQVPT